MTENRLTPKMFIGKELRLAREAKGLSRAKVAKMLIVSESLVTKWERGDLIPLEDHLTGTNKSGTESVRPGLRDILEIPEVVLRMINELVLNDEGSEWNQWPVIEQEASALWACETSLIPGLLQTESYARATLLAAGATEDLEAKVTARLARQEILTREDPATYVALISESALENTVDGPEVMHEQLEHLEQMAQRPNVVVQVIPHSSPTCAALVGGFVIASVNGEDHALADSQIKGSIIKQKEHIARLRRVFDIMRADSLRRQESLEAIRKAKEQWAT